MTWLRRFSRSCSHIVVATAICCLATPLAYAKRIDIKWGEIPGAQKYEYQLGRGESFSGDLVRSGTTRNLYFVTDLGPGVYFLRVRALSDAGRAGAWSQGTRMVVEASALEIKKPGANENIEVASEQSSFLAEWLAIEGAEDYQVQIKHGSDQRTIISPTSSVRMDGLKPGAWTISVLARAGGQVIQKSAEVAFKITVNPKPKPIIYSPMSGESTIAWDHFTVRWLNVSPNPKSEVVIRRMGDKTGVISREVVYGAAETLTPKLPPGNYQITVRNIYQNMMSEAAVVDIRAVADAMGFHAKYFGVTFQAVLGPTFGTTGFRKAAYKALDVTNSNASGEIDFKASADLSDQWGLELGVGARGDRYSDNIELSTTGDGSITVASSRLQPTGMLGARYKIEPLGPTKPIWIRSWLFWRQIEIPTGGTGGGFDPSSSEEPKFNISNARVLGTGFGAEMRWGGYRSRWDVIGRFDMLVPWVGRGAMLATAGASPFLPSLELRIIPRIKVSSELRLGMTLGGRFETVTMKEKSGESSKYISNRIFVMPTMTWDL